MEFLTFDYRREKSVVTITLNRPYSLNALNHQFLTDLNQLLDQLENDTYPPLLIITATGKAFAAGADISEMVNMTTEEARKFSDTGQKTLSRLEQYSMPVIAAINGYALGGGCELAMACDIRLATENARLGLPEASLGLIPGFGGTQRLPRLAGLGNALFMMLTSESVSAHEALQMGLVQQLCPPDRLEETVNKMAEKISSLGPTAIRNIKRIVRQGSSLPYQDGYELETNGFSPLFEHQGQTGMRAFLEKKKPQWETDK